MYQIDANLDKCNTYNKVFNVFYFVVFPFLLAFFVFSVERL